MLMRKNMIFAETVITGTAGTITELQIWIIRIGSTTDSAFVPIALLGFFLALTASSCLKLNRLKFLT